MRAVNLIPVDARRGSAAPGRSGGAVYVLLGALAVAVVALASYVLLENSISSRRSELAKVTRDANTAQATAAALAPYRQFAKLSQMRVQTVGALATSRFDWERVMRQMAVVLPQNVWLTSFIGTVAPGITFGGTGVSSTDTGTLRSSQQVPAVELVGCTETQAGVAEVLTRLRLMQDVTQVSLASSEKSDESSAGGGGGAGSGANSNDCRHGSTRFPQFAVVVFFKPLAGTPGRASAPAAPGGAVGAAKNAAAQSTPTSGGTGK